MCVSWVILTWHVHVRADKERVTTEKVWSSKKDVSRQASRWPRTALGIAPCWPYPICNIFLLSDSLSNKPLSRSK